MHIVSCGIHKHLNTPDDALHRSHTTSQHCPGWYSKVKILRRQRVNMGRQWQTETPEMQLSRKSDVNVVRRCRSGDEVSFWTAYLIGFGRKFRWEEFSESAESYDRTLVFFRILCDPSKANGVRIDV